MEEKKKLKRPRKGLLCLIGLLLIITVTTAVAAVSKMTGNNGANDRNLRKQLEDASVTEVTLSEDVRVGSPLEINGSKTINGSGTILAADNFVAEDNSALLMLSQGSQVTIGGTVIVDAANVDCGVYIAEGSTLTLSEEASLLNASGANIYALGEVVQKGGNIEAGFDNVYLASGASFTWESGINKLSINHGIHVEKDATLHTTSDKAEMRETGSHGVYLQGEAIVDDVLLIKSAGNQIDILPSGSLTMNGGSIAFGSAHGVSNQGTMVMNGGSIYNHEYCGVVNTSKFDMVGGSILNNSDKGIVNKNGGKLTIVNEEANISSNASGICNEEKAYCELAYAKVGANKTNNVINLGEMYIHDITLENSGSNSINTQYGGHSVVKNVVIDGTAGNHGIYCAFAGAIEMENVTIKNTAKRGIQNYDGTITGSNIAFENIANCAIASLSHARLGSGTITLDNVTTKDVKSHNIFMDANGAGTVTITNSTLGATGSNNIAIKAGEVYLTNVKVEGNAVDASDSTHGVYTTDGELYMKNCTISNVKGSAIRNNGGQIVLDNLKTSNVTVHNIFASKGNTALNNSTLNASKYHHIYCKGGIVTVNNVILKEGVKSCLSVTANGMVTVKDSTFEATSSNNVTITGGKTTLNNTKVLGNLAKCKASVHGVYAKEGGKIFLYNSTVSNTTGGAIRNNGGYVEIKNLSVADIGVNNVYASGGETIVKDSSLEKTNSNNIFVTRGKVVLNNVNLLGTNEKDSHAIYAEAGEVYIENTFVKDTVGAVIRNKAGYIEANDLATENCGSYTIHSSDTAKSIIKNSTLGVNANQNSVYASGGTIKIEKTKILGTTKENTHGIYTKGGSVYVNDSLISNVAGVALRNAGGYIQANKLETKNCGTYNVHTTTGDTVINASQLGVVTTQNNIYVAGGNVTLQSTSILGTTKADAHGVYVVKGNAKIKNSYICNTAGAAIRNNTNGNVEISNLTVSNIATYNIHHSSAGKTIVKDSTLAAPNSKNNHVYCTTDGQVSLENSVLKKCQSNSIKVTGGTLALQNTNILGTIDKDTHGIYVTGGRAYINNSYISGIAGSAVRNDNGDVAIINLKTEDIQGYNVFASRGITLIEDCSLDLTNSSHDIRMNKKSIEGQLVLRGCVKSKEVLLDQKDAYVLVDGVLTEGSSVVLRVTSKEIGDVVAQSGSADDMVSNMKYLTLADEMLAEDMKLQINANNGDEAIIGSGTVSTNAARVGDNEYETLQTAIDVAKEEADKEITVELLKSISVTETVKIPEGCNITIKDDGAKIRTISRGDSWSGETDAMFHLGEGSTLSLTSTSTTDENIMLKVDGNKSNIGVTATSRMMEVPVGCTVNVAVGVQISNHKILNTSVASDNEVGGAISVNGGTLNVSGGVFLGNEARLGGAVNVSQAGSKVIMTGGTFTENKSSLHGGALRVNAASEVTMKNVSFIKNVAESNHGGAIRIQDVATDVTIENCSFESNTAKFGGAISNASTKDATKVDIIGNKFKQNTAKTSGGGGAINLAGAVKNVVLKNNAFIGNTGDKTGNDVRIDNAGAQVYLSGTNSFEAYIYKNAPAVLTLNDDFDTTSAITLICHDTQTLNNVLVKCPNAMVAEDAIECFTLSGMNLADYKLNVSGSNLVLAKK